jgi:predicted GNAT family N-acyltransferase
MDIQIEFLDRKRHNYSEFCCGEPSLDNYIQKNASQDVKNRVGSVFVLVDNPSNTVLAYYTLSSYTIVSSDLSESFTKRLPKYPLLPATLLGRLAVDSGQRGKRFGELLLLNALKRSLQASQQVGSLALVAEALDDRAAEFYLKYGFEQFTDQPLKLYFPMKSIESLFHS